MKTWTRAAAGAAIIALGASAAQAAPTFFAGTGNYYEYVGVALTQPAAFAAADAATLAGHDGYLVTITSQAEQDFLTALVAAANNGSHVLYWTAGVYDNGPDKRWEWGAGPEAGQALSYTNWNGGEPNGNASEPALIANWSGDRWNDWNAGEGRGYVVEYSATGVVPEPGAWALMILGFGSAGAVLRRKRMALA